MDGRAEVEPKGGQEIPSTQKPAFRVVEDDSKPPLSDLFIGDGSEAAEVVMLRLPPTSIQREN
eukprot:1188838-Prorocentrum_minimum.AAC.1